MSYAVTTNFDSRIPSWPGNGTPFTLVACHDTEGGQGRAGALGTIQFLIDRADRGASYHELWWYHESTDEFGVIRIVPTYRAAGSIAPQTTVYAPTQWVKDALGARWWDPNQGAYAVSIAGRVSDVDRYAKNPKFLVHAHRRMMELWKELNLTKRAEHFQFQPSNRTDWGKLLMTALGGLTTSDRWQPPVATETPMNITPITPTLMTITPTASIRKSPDLTAASMPFVVGKVTTLTVIGQINGVDFGAGPLWYAYVINTGGLRFFHSQDVTAKTALSGDTAALDSQISALNAKVASLTSQAASLKAEVASLNAKVQTQADRIASLLTQVAEVELARTRAETAATEAVAAAASGLVLRDALRDFMN